MQPYRVIGVESSPYAVKVRAVMRYRRIPHIWVARMPQFFEETRDVRPPIMPVAQFPDGEYRTDSTPIILALENAAAPGERSVMPDDAGHAFLSALIEDMADEQLTKSLFHYRFSGAADQRAGGGWVMDDAYPDVDTAEWTALTDEFIARQIDRMHLVGCTPENGPLFEAFYRELLTAMEGFVATDRFLFGSRPSLADFGLYGQLRTLSADPTPAAIMRDIAPRTLAWTRRLDDASGVEGGWSAAHPVVEKLLALAGRIYLPFLEANAVAIGDGAEIVELALEGRPYRQPPFRYQGKCRDLLLRRFHALPAEARDRIEPMLEAAGCLRYLAEPAQWRPA